MTSPHSGISREQEWNVLIDAVRAATSCSLSTMELMHFGESGAYRVQDEHGKQLVLKHHPSPNRVAQFKYASNTVAQLRKTGYPAPRHLAQGVYSGGAWQLVEWVPGESHRPVTSGTLEQLLALVEQHRGRAIEASPGWVEEMVDSILIGCDGYCQTKTLREHSGRTRQLLSTLEEWAEAARGLHVGTSDIVHFDFHPGNILIETASVSAVIDWTGVCAGDATFDLVTLLFYIYDQPSYSAHLVDIIERVVGGSILRLYMGHVILRQVDWSIRHHDAKAVTFYLEHSERIVEELSLLT